MKKETTYNKYKRQNQEMKVLLSIEVKRFVLDREDWKSRVDYIGRCMNEYRFIKMEQLMPSSSSSTTFNCDECCKDKNEKPDNINGKGKYCKECIDKMFSEDMK